MKKVIIATCLAAPALCAFTLPAAAVNSMRVTSSVLTLTVADTDANDGVAAGYSTRNLRQWGHVTVSDTIGSTRDHQEGFSVNSPELLPQDAYASYGGVRGALISTGQLGGFTMEMEVPDGILTGATGRVFDASFGATQSFVLQPHTTLTFSGSYQFAHDFGPNSIPAEGGDIWLDTEMKFSLQAGFRSVIYEDFYFSEQRNFTFQLTNNTDFISEQSLSFGTSARASMIFVPEVPEPATWGMMAAGLSLLAMRARRKTRA